MIRVLVVVLFAAILSCNNQPAGNTGNEFEKDSMQSETSSPVFLIPSPAETFQLLMNEKMQMKPIAGNSPDNVNKYQTVFSRAANLGIYSTDATYAVLSGQNNQIGGYFKTIKILLEQLNLTHSLDQTTLDKLEQNMNATDSLYAMSLVLYEKMNTELDNETGRPLQIMLMYGGWIEGMYLTTQLIEKYDSKNPLALRVSEQDLVLDNLLGAIETVPQDAETELIAANIVELNSILQTRYEQANAMLTPDKYAEFKTKVKELRNNIVNN